MLNYDKSQALIFIHIPKTAGTSVRAVFEEWFGADLLFHYYKEASNLMPVRHEIFSNHPSQQAPVVYGHFNRRRKFGVEDYYPSAKQFITILRDPLERLISNYFYIKKVGQKWSKHSSPIEPDLIKYVQENKSVMLNYFPREVTLDNYKEIIEQYFVEIGVLENIELSMQRIASKLEKPFGASMLEHVNATERSQNLTEDLRSAFIENNQLEYTVFNYVKNNYFDKNGKIYGVNDAVY